MRVLGCAYTHDKDTPSFFAYMDDFGEVVDFRRFDDLSKRKYANYDKERQDKEEDLKKLKKFVQKCAPNAIVISGETRDVLSLIEEVKEVLGQLEAETDIAPIPVEFMEPNVAHIYSKSRRGKVRQQTGVVGMGVKV